MPYAEILVTKNFITDEEKTVLVKKMTKILLDSEGLIDNPISRSIALLDIKEFGCLYVGGERSKQDKILVKIYAFSNAFNDKSKKKLFSDITNALISINDKIKSQNGRNIWCMIIPLQKNNFGVGGAPVTLEMTRNLVSAYNEE
ncbi:hypothetical protein [Halocella sp. SP3-1]|uniref:hypothetical protein n=1 Tax=Halocella sp. SP3-1 TaxID=2382161 RepID=UPI000F758EF2|nr:hypothetical protein [Halocella sp. SP3-1]AZO93650.1 hypothetical protein D7D81_03040 [Halocella sp. SP3-1]